MYYILSLIIFAFTFGSLNPRSELGNKQKWAYFIHQNRIFLLDNLQKCTLRPVNDATEGSTQEAPMGAS